MFRVRPATPDDTPALAEIFRASRRKAFYWRETEDFFLSDFVDQTKGEVVHLAETLDGVPVGFTAVWEQNSFIHHLFVAPEFQRLGIGTLLLNSLEQWLPKPHRLKCLVANESAVRFYHSLGWTEISRGSDIHGAYYLLQSPDHSESVR
jgi:GNAT superfamily N-acetyltransferase